MFLCNAPRPTLPMLCALILLASACRDRTLTIAELSQVDNAHGFRIGDTIPSHTLRCLRKSERQLGSTKSTQLVTFSNPGDCSTCIAHLRSIESIAAATATVGENFIVTWGPGFQYSDLERLYGSSRARDACFDSAGFAWDALHLEHTPVTALLISGRVAFMTDKAYRSDSSRRMAASIIATLVEQRRNAHP